MEHEGDNYTNCDWCSWYNHQRIIKGTGGLGGRGMSGNHPNYNIIENGQYTEKSPGDLRRLAVTQTPVKDLQLQLMRKNLKELIIIMKGWFSDLEIYQQINTNTSTKPRYKNRDAKY